MIATKSIMIQSKSQPTHALYPDEPAVGFPSYRLPPDAKYFGELLVRYEAYRSTRETKPTLSELLNQGLESQIAYLRPVVPTRARRAGFAKGTFPYIAPDFDRPLEDFADYQLTEEEVENPTSQRDTAGTRPLRLTGPIMFVRILLRTWRLSQTNAIPLLGLEESDSSYAEDLLNGRVTLRGRDIKDRIAYLFRIRKTLSALFRDEEVENEWLREPHDALDGKDPIALLLEGSMENLLLVKEYVEAAAGR